MKSDLIERFQAGETGWEIDSAVHWLFSEWRNIGGGWREHKQTGKREQFNYGSYPEVSTSLDAAVSLVERVRPGWDWLISKNEGVCLAGIEAPDEPVGMIGVQGRAPTPAAALIAALLKSEG